MTRFLPLLAALAGLIATSIAQAGGPDLVLVASKRSPLMQMTVPEVRKAFLGMPLTVNGQGVKPLRNLSDRRVAEIFMQRVMFMSMEEYERRIEARVARTGGGRPPAYDDTTELMTALQRDPLAITYLPRHQVGSDSGLKIIGET